MNADFQSIAKRDKKAFFSDQCKETEENNRMGKNRYFFNKIRATKISCKDGHNKGQKWQKRLRRGGKNTENYTIKVLTTWIIPMV